MSPSKKPAFLYHFDALEDPRIDRKKLYPLPEIPLVVLCGSICGAQSWRDFQWIEPIRETLQETSLEPGYWQSTQETPAWYSWSGYAFEAICYKHLSQIRKKLQIPLTAIANSWRYVSQAQSKEEGAQIDLLFDRKDNAITLCEIKYSEQPFVIDKQYAKNLLNKKTVFVEKTRTKKQIFIAMIAANGIKDTLYSEEYISAVATLDDLFT